MKIGKYIFIFLLISAYCSLHAENISQSIKGDGNVGVVGNNNTLNNKPNISQNGKVVDNYDSQKAVQDLSQNNYSNIVFTDKGHHASKLKKLLLVTATNFETKIIHEEANKVGLNIQKQIVNDQIIYNLGVLGGIEIIHMQPGTMGMLEPSSTPLIIMSVFNEIKPHYIIATGIAYGRKSKGHQLGDIIVSRQLVNYESRKESNGDIFFRGDKVTSNMLQRIDAAVHSWKGVPVHEGLVLSGNALVNSKKFLEYLSTREPEYIGGEMEGYGVYSVASMLGAKWIMIKGISDWGDGTKNDDFHEKALHHVGSFIFHMVGEGNLK